MMNLIQSAQKRLMSPVSIAPLVTFRIIFGFLMLFSTIRFVFLGWIEDHYIQPMFHFKYWGFEWLPVFSGEILYLIHFLMILAAIGVILGAFYRISAILLFLTFTYTELIDLTYYLNHYYFVSIVCLLMIFLPANRYFSIDVIRKPFIETATIARWPIAVIKFQLAIVYTFAGLAKINHDWLFNALPLKIWLPANDAWPLVGFIFKWKALPYIFSWAGMLYDCAIVLFLSWRPTRIWAYMSVVFFHVITGLMFQIGVFPLVMMGATLIFFPENLHQRFIEKLKSLFSKNVKQSELKSQVNEKNERIFAPGKILMFLLIAHFAFQLIFPWRYLLYPGNLFWTEEGYRYSWRVMLMEKAGTATFYVKDGNEGREGVVVNSDFLNAHQEKQMAMQPDMILQFAHMLEKYYQQNGMNDPVIRAEVYVTLNARPSQLLINPQVDLTQIKDTFKPKNWILPYESR